MELNVNSGLKLAKEIQPFKSPHVKGLSLKNSQYYMNGRKTPYIESSQISDLSGINAEFSTKKLANGGIFEVYRMKDVVLKLIKNKFGDIKAFKLSGMEKSDVMPKENIIENTKQAFAAKVKSFFD
mgnify:CR=1 FL=1